LAETLGAPGAALFSAKIYFTAAKKRGHGGNITRLEMLFYDWDI
jgi:hypothetical protein